MGSNKVIKGVNDLLSQNQLLASEWNYQKNQDLMPDMVAFRSNKKVWWLCPKCGYEWEAIINNRSKGNGCPCCSNQIVVEGINDLQTTNPQISRDWNYEKNKPLLPCQIVEGSSKKVWWICNTCGHEWKATVVSRKNGNGCPKCNKQVQLNSFHETMIKQRGSFFDNNPDLVEEWLQAPNGDLSPKDFLSGSNKKVWWKCKKCGHEWRATIHSRAKNGVGCPLCSNKTVVKGKNDLETNRPDLIAEWNYEKNDVLPSEVSIGSSKKVWWICKNCGNEWEAGILYRVKGTGCPVCKSRAQTSFPEQALFYYVRQAFSDSTNRYIEKVSNTMFELDIYIPSKKIGIEYDGLAWHNSKQSEEREKRKYFFCKEKGIKLIRIKEIEGEKKIERVADQVFFCNNHPSFSELNKVISETLQFLGERVTVDCEKDSIKIRELYYRDIHKNSLEEKHPDLLKEWNYIKNGAIKPSMISSGSQEKIWWICDKGHEWKVSPASRIYFNSGCPYCSNRKVLKGVNDLETTNPSLLKYWDYENNKDVLPNEITAGNQKQKVWWICDNGHHFNTSVYQYLNLNDCKCPICSGKEILQGYNDLLSLNPRLASEWSPHNSISPKQVGLFSNKKVKWICENGHEWEASVCNRNQGTGCPYCSNRKLLVGFNDIASTDPNLLEEWDYQKNEIKPTEIMIGSSKRIWWKCKKCGYEWEVAPVNRKKGTKYTSCPACTNKAVFPGYNDFETLCPEQAKFWNYEKNKGLVPSMFMPKSEKRVWWKCEYGHEYERDISHQSRGYRCPICYNRKKIK